MTLQKSSHTFHIPVMGTGYTIDSPVKVAHYGISSVVSLADHKLLEQMHEHYATEYILPFQLVPKNDIDRRAKVITGYLNLLDVLVKKNLLKVKNTPFEKDSEITKYFELLPFGAPLKREYVEMLKQNDETQLKMQNDLREKITAGSIDVNVMTKLDKTNYNKKEAMPAAYNDAHAAVRGFANSTLNGSIVLSAGMNPRLFSYMSKFEDFYPDEKGHIKKGIILKVSDYRSAIIQGKFLAKKGLWVSEFRIESGLNCGGHAFATEGYLLGPILQEFKDKREELQLELYKIYSTALNSTDKTISSAPPQMAVTVQGGVGTAEEHKFLLEHYNVDSVGWGTPFLLVPEAVCIDEATIKLLVDAREKDLYLSNISPLGVPFNSVRNNTAEQQRIKRIEAGKPGSPCIKEHLVSSTEFTEKPLCTASRNYQKQKILELQHAGLEQEVMQKEIDAVTQKTCLCMGLANSALTASGIPKHKILNAVAVCPGPNLAYFSKVVSLQEMIDHIYGRTNIISVSDRPNMFIKELKLYVDYFKSKIKEAGNTEKEWKNIEDFKSNLLEGIEYYKELFRNDNSGNLMSLMRIKIELSVISLNQRSC